MSAELFRRYSRHEDGVIGQFNNRHFYKTGMFNQFSADQVRYYLLQLGFIAQNFLKWYQQSALGITDPEAREVIRQIMRSEVPQDGPTHQEDRFADLALLGLSRRMILNTSPTPDTQRVVDRLFDITRYTQRAPHFDLSILVMLRVAGEILVAEQYKPILGHWNITFGLQPKQSRFFLPHIAHDQKRGSKGHAGAFDKVLTRLIRNENALRIAMMAAETAESVRSSFNIQFVAMTGRSGHIRNIPGVPATKVRRARRGKAKK